MENKKDKLIAMLLCIFLGYLGVHMFYVGRVGAGIARWFLTPLTFGIIILVDLIKIAQGKFEDADGNYVT